VPEAYPSLKPISFQISSLPKQG